MVMPVDLVDPRSHQTRTLIVNPLRFVHHHVDALILGLKPSEFGHQLDDALRRQELTGRIDPCTSHTISEASRSDMRSVAQSVPIVGLLLSQAFRG